ncbi:MAG: hypothetical protein ACM3O4_05905 [Ignavibacteriales bacterium]
MNIGVIKFGGTSLIEDLKENVLKIIKDKLIEYDKLIVIVSAIGRNGDNYATDTLKNLCINSSNKEKALLMTVGETISTVILSDYLNQNKINSIAVNIIELGFNATNEYLNANVINFNSEYIDNYLLNYDVVIIPGFQGLTCDKQIVTLGRGGSDLTAVIIAHKYKVDYLYIYKDIEGIMNINPKVVKNGTLFKNLSYNFVINLSFQGSEVINYKAAIKAKKLGVKIKVGSTITGICKTTISDNKGNNIGFSFINDLVYLETNNKELSKIKELEYIEKYYKYSKTILTKEVFNKLDDIEFIKKKMVSKIIVLYDLDKTITKELRRILVNNNIDIISMLNYNDKYIIYIDQENFHKSMELIYFYFKGGDNNENVNCYDNPF